MKVYIAWERNPGLSIAIASGRIDGMNVADFQRLLDEGIDLDENDLILDLERVNFVSSAGLRVGVMTAKKLSTTKRQFALCALPSTVREVFSISGFDKVIPIYGSRRSAIDALEEARGKGAESRDAGFVRSAYDIGVVEDNIQDIADFTIEKYEFANSRTLSRAIRGEIAENIRAVLWARIRELRLQRKQILEDMFNSAEEILAKAVSKEK